MEKIFIKEIIVPIFIITISFLCYILLKKVLRKVFQFRFSRTDERKQKTLHGLIVNVIRYFIICIDILMILEVFGVDTKTLVTSLGVVGFVVGLAFQDLLKDFIAGMTIILENQYSVGDVIKINEFKGEVLEVGMKSTKIRSYTGEVLIIANHNIQEVVNYSLKPSLAIVDISVSYDENLDKVENVLNSFCLEMSQSLEDIVGNVELLGVERLASSSIDFRLTVETEPTKQFGVQRILKKKVKEYLEKEGIKIPYSQMVVHYE